MLKIGVTGHINIDINYIDRYKEEISDKLYNLKQDDNLILYSSLADGADRLVVYEAIKLDIKYIAVIPMEKILYKNDFDAASQLEFEELLYNANYIVTLPHTEPFNRDFQYEQAGRYISQNSDVLFALWDGKYNNLQGGTSEIVKYHLENKKQLCHFKVLRNRI